MRRVILPVATLLLAIAFSSTARAGVPWIKGEISTAFAEAKVKNRPLLVYFYTSWCSWCLELDDKVFSNDDVAAATDAFVPLRLNCDRGACNPFWLKYNLTSLPTVLALTPDGEVLGRLGMYRPVPGFLRFLSDCLDPGETMAAVDARIQRGERPPELLLRSAEQHFEANDVETATRRFEEVIRAVPKGQTSVAPDAHIGLGRIKSSAGDDKGALKHYATVLESYPGSSRLAEAFVSSLVILREQNKSKEIDALFNRHAGRFAEEPAVLNDHAKRILETGGNAALAFEKGAKAARLSPDTPDYHATTAQALLALKRPIDALDSINTAIRIRATNTQYRLLRLEILDAVHKSLSAGSPSTADAATPPAKAEDPLPPPSTTAPPDGPR